MPNVSQTNSVYKCLHHFDKRKGAFYEEQGQIHGYLSRVRVGRGGEKKLSVTDRPTDRPTNGQSGL